MGFMNFIKGELLEVIEWKDDGSGALVYRFPDNDAAIKMGAQLTVREGQAAIFINEGKLADVFTPGRYKLQTANMPVLTKLMSWAHGFNSPFKCDVYFVRTTQVTDQKWGTPNPIMMRDAEIGPVRVRAFGSFSYRVADPGKFMIEIVGTEGRFAAEDIAGQLKAHVVTEFTDALGEAKVPVLDLAANYKELGATIGQQMKGDLESKYGLALTTFLISNISLPPQVEEMLDKRSSMGLVGDMGRFTQFQAANAMEAAAKAPGGGAAGAMGLGAGVAMGQAMMSAMTAAQQPQQPAPAPAPAAGPGDLATRLGKLKTLLDAGLISQADFDAKKAEILSSI